MTAKPKTLYVSDLDGTLLDDCSRVSPESARIISQLSRRGSLITVATARTPATVQPKLQDVYTTVPAVTMTGAALWDRNACRYIDVQRISQSAAAQALAICRREGVHPFIYTQRDEADDEPTGTTSIAPHRLEVYRNGPRSKGEQKFIDERSRLALKRFILDSPKGEADYIPGTIMMFAMGSRDKIFDVAREIEAKVDCSVSAYVDIFGADTGILEIFASGVSKAVAVRRLADSLGAQRIIAFGDNLNDLTLKEVSDEFYAVANALPAVQQAATAVIGPNTADSVALKILELEGNNGVNI